MVALTLVLPEIYAFKVEALLYCFLGVGILIKILMSAEMKMRVSQTHVCSYSIVKASG